MSATQSRSTSAGYFPHLLLSVCRRSVTVSMSWAISSVLPVARLAQVGRRLAGEHALDLADAGDDGGHAPARAPREALVGDGLDELARPEAAGVARGAPGGQDVVRADGLVGIGDGRILADEQRAVVAEASEEPVVVRRLHLEMLGRVLVGDPRGLLVPVH